MSDLAAHLHKQLAVVVAWVAATGYAIDVAEDYLDWGEKPILDRIPGVKHIVESHLAAA